MQIDRKLLASLNDIEADYIDTIHNVEDLIVANCNGLSLFEVAVIENNTKVIDYLLCFPELIQSYLPLTLETDNAKYMAKCEVTEGCLANAELNVSKAWTRPVSFLRTPLMIACRRQNIYAIQALLQKGASLKGKDIFGMKVLEICWESGGQAFLQRFIALLNANNHKFKLDANLLARMVSSPSAIEEISDYKILDAGAKRIIFNYYCASLQLEKVTELLVSGFKINQMHSKKFHAVFEVCTSHLVWCFAYPEHLTTAYRYTKAHGLASNSSITFTFEGDDWGEKNKQAMAESERLKQEVADFTLTPQLLDEQLQKRLVLLDLFMDYGLDAEVVEKKVPTMFLYCIFSLNEPALIQKLFDCGFKLIADEDDFLSEEQAALLNSITGGKNTNSTSEASSLAFYDSPFSWELESETVLYAKVLPKHSSDKTAEIQVSLCNIYGPLEGISVHINANRKKSDKVTMTLLEEFVELDDEKVAVNELTEPLCEEAPWTAVYSASLSNVKTDQELLIEVSSPRLNAELTGLKL